jgi:single stranded DNA-binding protein
MMQIACHARFGQDPREIQTSTGKPMAVASVAVSLTDRQGEESTEWLGVVAFGKQAELLLRHKKGDLASIAGRVQRNKYTANGEQRSELQVIVDSIVSARTARPGGGKRTRKGQSGSPQPAPAGDDVPFDDEIPFGRSVQHKRNAPGVLQYNRR